MKKSSIVHVAVAVIENPRGEILISLRPDHVHQGRLWEFPGGKVKNNESVEQALHREINEEVGLNIISAFPLIQIPHDYGDRFVLLDVWQVTAFEGNAQIRTGLEGQKISWVNRNALSQYAFPIANRPIITAIQLPEIYLITPESHENPATFLKHLENSLSENIKLVQLRVKMMDKNAFTLLARRCVEICHQHNIKIIFNTHYDLIEKMNADGVHLTSEQIYKINSRPVPADKLLGVSCHNAEDLQRAALLSADFAVLGPVLQTVSHTDGHPIGWELFSSLVHQALLPIYALGGVGYNDIKIARQNGAQGVAGISGFWNYDD